MTLDRQVEIAKRAYSIWEMEGRPSGRDLEHWLRAEAEVERAASAKEVPAPPVKPKRPTKRRAARTK